MHLEDDICGALAQAFTAAAAKTERVAHADQLLGRPWHWVRLLAGRYANATQGQSRLRASNAYTFLRKDGAVRRALTRYSSEIRLTTRLLVPASMQPVPAAASWNLPPITTAGDLADWLWLSPEQLEWYANLDRFTTNTANEKLHHYHYRLEPKARGGHRLIEIPKRRLRKHQRQILRYILDLIPPHPAAHGFVKGRNIRTFTQPHTGQSIVLRLDLQDFFPTIHAPRVQAMFRAFGYPESVADLLGGLCTNVTPDYIRKAIPDQLLLRGRHLPQGAPTSPALANLCAYRLDCRLTGLATAAGARYTRYADDLAFSGDATFARAVHRFAAHIAAIVDQEGFRVNHHKTRIMRDGVRQHLAGLTVNEKPNIGRETFDQWKAILTNCLRHGPATQNRGEHSDFRAHLAGRVAFLASINPEKGARLRALFDRIAWKQ